MNEQNQRNIINGEEKSAIVSSSAMDQIADKELTSEINSLDKNKTKESLAAKNKIANSFGFAGGAVFFTLNLLTGIVPGGFIGGVLGYLIGFGLAWMVLAFVSKHEK